MPASSSMRVGALDQAAHPRTRSQDCAQLICGALRSFAAPRTQLHSYLSKSPRGPRAALEEPQGVPWAAPCPSCIFLFWQGAKNLVPARVGKEEMGEGAWGRGAQLLPSRPGDRLGPGRLGGSCDGEVWKEFARRSVRRSAEFDGLGGIPWGKVYVIVICEPGNARRGERRGGAWHRMGMGLPLIGSRPGPSRCAELRSCGCRWSCRPVCGTAWPA